MQSDPQVLRVLVEKQVQLGLRESGQDPLDPQVLQVPMDRTELLGLLVQQVQPDQTVLTGATVRQVPKALPAPQDQ